MNSTMAPLTVQASGGTQPYSYSNDGGSTWQESNFFDKLAPDTYNIVVRDYNSCECTLSITITQPYDLACSATSTNITCYEFNDGTITVQASGGTQPYSYSNDGGLTWQESKGLFSIT